MRALLGRAVFLGAACVSFSTEAEDLWGCQVLLCLSNPDGPEALSECRPPIERLHEHLRHGHPFPSCPSGGSAYARPTSSYYDLCPAGDRRTPRGAIRCGSISHKGGVLRDRRWWRRCATELWWDANPDSPQSVRWTPSGAGYRLLTNAGRWRSWGSRLPSACRWLLRSTAGASRVRLAQRDRRLHRQCPLQAGPLVARANQSVDFHVELTRIVVGRANVRICVGINYSITHSVIMCYSFSNWTSSPAVYGSPSNWEGHYERKPRA